MISENGNTVADLLESIAWSLKRITAHMESDFSTNLGNERPASACAIGISTGAWSHRGCGQAAERCQRRLDLAAIAAPAYRGITRVRPRS
jgi:hypothetical protein